MAGETNLDVLIQSMKPALHAGVYVFCTMDTGAALPAGLAPVCLFQEDEGTTLILRQSEAEQAGIAFQFPSRWITLSIHSSLEAVGFLAAVTKVLAAAGISVNPVSAYFHDHLFVPSDRAEEAMILLQAMTQKS